MKETKQCKCGKELPLEEFPFKNKSKGVRGTTCKSCMREYGKKHYQENKSKYLESKKLNQDKYRLRNRQYVYDYLKNNNCTDCGESDPVVLEFDHKKDKEYNVSELIFTGCSTEKLQKEIDKCEVVCSNCHKRRTAKQFGFYKGLK